MVFFSRATVFPFSRLCKAVAVKNVSLFLYETHRSRETISSVVQQGVGLRPAFNPAALMRPRGEGNKQV